MSSFLIFPVKWESDTTCYAIPWYFLKCLLAICVWSSVKWFFISSVPFFLSFRLLLSYRFIAVLCTFSILILCWWYVLWLQVFFFQFVTYLFLRSVCQISFCHFLPSFHLPSFNTINCPQNKPTWHSLVPYFLMYLHFGSHDFKEPSVKHLLVFHWWTTTFKYLGEFS